MRASAVRYLFSAALALLLGATSVFAQIIRPPSTPVIGYTPGRTQVEGNQPLTTNVTITITSPSNLPAGVPVTIRPSLVLLSAPTGVSESIALSFITMSSTALTFTGPEQSVALEVEGYFPAEVAAGAYAYQILTSGWGVEAQDQGAFLNATVYPPISRGTPPTVAITSITDNAQFVYRPLVGPLQVPLAFTSAAPAGFPITAIDSDLNGTVVTLPRTTNPDGTITSSGTATITSGGIFTLRARASNSEGTGTDDVTFTVLVEAPPPTVAIASPTTGSSYNLPSSGALTVPYSFTGRSSYGGVTSLTATLNGQAVTFTPAGLGTLTATGSGNFSITTTGTYELVVTVVDQNGTASTKTSFTVNGPIPPPTVSIAAPLNGATFTRVAGSPATQIPFTFTGRAPTGYTITSLTGTLNGSPVSATITGLNTATSTGTGTLSISAPGTYVLSAVARSAGGTASTSVTFTVTQTLPPKPACSINWLPPISLGKPFKAGSQVAIKFELTCNNAELGQDRTGDGDPDFYPGQRTKSKINIDRSVIVAVTEILSGGAMGTPRYYSYTNQPCKPGYTIQGNDMYHLNFPAPTGARRYRVEVFQFPGGIPQVVGTREFTTR